MIERRLENLLALDYPADRLEIVVASDASTDRTNELVEAVAAREPRVRLLDCPRGGKVAAQDRAVRETSGEVVAFSDANATWAPDALRHLVADLADPEVAYVCGRLRLEDAAGSNREGLYWRYELWLREQESRLGSITGGNGSIYALDRSDYVEVDPRWGHDLAFPYRMVQAGRRAVYQPRGARLREADADERDRVRAQGAHVRALLGDHAPRLDAQAAPARLPRLDRLPPPAPLRERAPPRRAARDERRARARGLAVRARAPRPARAARRVRGRRADRALLHVRDVGHRAGALELPPPRCPRGVGSGGDPVNRLADVALAGLGLVVSSPFLAAAALAVKLEDGGPILFRQTRVGKDGVDFELLKLRSMVVDAEQKGAGFAVDRGDARITRVGRLLRRTSIDELPQLWNVVRGEMSVIGPRPTLRYQVERYTERQRKRLAVRPGLTGWAQIHGRAELPWADRIELDVWYVENRSPPVDLRILLRTPLALFGGTYRGATGAGARDPRTRLSCIAALSSRRAAPGAAAKLGADGDLRGDRVGRGDRRAQRDRLPRDRGLRRGRGDRLRAGPRVATAGCPTHTGSYYTPPGFFAIGGVAIELGEALGLDHPRRVGQVFNALAAVGTLLLLLVLVRLLWPGRDRFSTSRRSCSSSRARSS